MDEGYGRVGGSRVESAFVCMYVLCGGRTDINTCMHSRVRAHTQTPRTLFITTLLRYIPLHNTAQWEVPSVDKL